MEQEEQWAINCESMTAWNQALAKVIDDDFNDNAPSELLCALEQVTQSRSSMIIVYPAETIPYIPCSRLLPFEDPEIHLVQYLNGAYLLDPFYLQAKEAAEGVFLIKDVAPDGFEDSEYYRVYHHAVDLYDEASILINDPAGSIVQISLGRHSGDSPILPSEKALLESLFPIVKSVILKWLQSQKIEIPDENIKVCLDAALENFGSSLLTNRECQILNLVLRGHSIKSISQRLENSVETIKHHRKNIYLKLDVSTQSELFYLFIDSLRSTSFDPTSDPLKSYMSTDS